MKLARPVCVSLMIAVTLAACSDPSDGGSGGAGSSGGSANPAPTTTTSSAMGAGAGGAAPDTGGATTGSGGSAATALPLGTVEDQGTVACGPDPLTADTTCSALTVTCPGLDPIGVTLSVSEPTTPIGTIVVHDGGGGTDYFGRPDLTRRYLDAGYRIVDVRWASDWEGNSGIKTAACRTSTLIRYAFDKIHGGDLDKGFCGQGQSGGSGVMSYALAHYGLGDVLDAVLISSGPPFGRMDCGCGSTAPECDAPPPQCPELTSAALAAGRQLPSKVAGWEGLEVCGAGASAADIAKYAADSVVSPGGVYDYPKTALSAWQCALKPNSTGAGQAFFLAQVTSLGAPAKVSCSTNCESESIYNPDAVLADGTLVADDMVETVRKDCRPHHQP